MTGISPEIRQPDYVWIQNITVKNNIRTPFVKIFFPFLKEYAQLNDTQKAGIVLSLAKMFPDINLGQECEVEVNVKVKQIPLERRLLENYPKADMGKVREIVEDSVNDFYPEIEI